MSTLCVLCDREHFGVLDLCIPCEEALKAQVKAESQWIKIQDLSIFSLASYQGPLKSYVSYLKSSGSHWKIESLITLEMIARLIPSKIFSPKPESLCAIPSSRLREMDSHSLSTALGLEISRLQKIPVLHPSPRRSFWSDLFFETDQKNKRLPHRQLSEHLWKWPRQFSPKASRCLIIDDVITTGGSLLCLSSGLKDRGIPVVGAITLLHSKKLERQNRSRIPSQK